MYNIVPILNATELDIFKWLCYVILISIEKIKKVQPGLYSSWYQCSHKIYGFLLLLMKEPLKAKVPRAHRSHNASLTEYTIPEASRQEHEVSEEVRDGLWLEHSK